MKFAPQFLLLLALALIGLSGCSTFDSQWKSAHAPSRVTRWDGRWTSEHHVTKSGSAMGGRLRAVLEPLPDGRILTTFHANWLVFSGNYTMTLEPRPPQTGLRKHGGQEYQGNHELPKMFGGVYHYEAKISDNHFTARYTSSYDHGTFTMERLPAGKD